MARRIDRVTHHGYRPPVSRPVFTCGITFTAYQEREDGWMPVWNSEKHPITCSDCLSGTRYQRDLNRPWPERR